MKVVKISDAKANLSRYLDLVRGGGRVRIVDRDVPVADIVPIEPVSSREDDEAWVASIERRGVGRRGKRGPVPAEIWRAGPKDREGGVVAALLEERRGGR
jgi:prevent-host-death family protein